MLLCCDCGVWTFDLSRFATDVCISYLREMHAGDDGKHVRDGEVHHVVWREAQLRHGLHHEQRHVLWHLGYGYS